MAKKNLAIGCLVIMVLAAVLIFSAGTGTYNSLVKLDQAVRAQWAQVENVYQRRADLVPNLVETVKGAADFEQSTLQAVTDARASVGRAQLPSTLPTDEAQLRNYLQAQQSLSGALSRLLVVSEQYPQLRATESFKDLQSQLEGTENRIAVERMRFNEKAQKFNTRRMSFPTVLVAGFFASRINEKPYFKAQAGAETAPKVKF